MYQTELENQINRIEENDELYQDLHNCNELLRKKLNLFTQALRKRTYAS